MGLAIGDALGQPRVRRSRESALRTFGRRPLRYRLGFGQGLYSDDTQLALMAGQAVLESRSQSGSYHRHFAGRLKWYVIGAPMGISKATFIAGCRAWVRRLGVKTGTRSAGSPPASRALLLGVVLHNTGHRYLVWSRDSAEATHCHPLAIDGAAVLATAAQIAAVTSTNTINTTTSLETLIRAAKTPELRAALTDLVPFLQQRRSPRAVAKHFKWKRSISRSMLPTAVMAVYCFLRYPTSFRHAVKWALILGGKNDTLPAIVGGLVGAHLGVDRLPAELLSRLGDWPHDRTWIQRLAKRLADWPHGVDDLLQAPALSSYPISQLLRNLWRWPLVLIHKLAGLAG